MTARWRCVILAGALTVAVGALPARAQETAWDRFELAFGQRFRAVVATPEPADDAALAKEMILRAYQAGTDAPLQKILCDKVHDLGSRNPATYDAATKALEALAKGTSDRKRKATYLEKAIELRQRQYSRSKLDARKEAAEALIGVLAAAAEANELAGDFDAARKLYFRAMATANVVRSPQLKALKAKLAGMVERRRAAQRLQEKIQQLRQRINANEFDAAARRRLILVYLLEKNDPEAAAALLTPICDADLRTHVPLTVKPAASLSGQDCRKLAEWYRDLSQQTVIKDERAGLLARAKAYYEACLKKDTVTGQARTEATAGLQAVAAALAKLGASGAEVTASLPDAWVDVLKSALPARRARTATGLAPIKGMSLDKHHGDVLVPVTTPAGYEFEVQFVVSDAAAWYVVYFPVGGHGAGLTVHRARGDKRRNYLQVRGGTGREGTSAASTAAIGKPQTLRIKVTPGEKTSAITVSADGKKQMNWEGPPASLEQGAGPKGIRIYVVGTVRFNAMRMRVASGKIQQVPVEGDSGPPRSTSVRRSRG